MQHDSPTDPAHRPAACPVTGCEDRWPFHHHAMPRCDEEDSPAAAARHALRYLELAALLDADADEPAGSWYRRLSPTRDGSIEVLVVDGDPAEAEARTARLLLGRGEFERAGGGSGGTGYRPTGWRSRFAVVVRPAGIAAVPLGAARPGDAVLASLADQPEDGGDDVAAATYLGMAEGLAVVEADGARHLCAPGAVWVRAAPDA